MAFRNGQWSKYKNKRSAFAGRSFASGLERDVYAMLLLMQKAGEISEIQCQDHVRLTAAQIVLIPDFKVTLPSGGVEWVEAKGCETDTWMIKKRLWAHYGPGKLTVWKRRGKDALYIAETIIPI
jgi:hypothetical protein